MAAWPLGVIKATDLVHSGGPLLTKMLGTSTDCVGCELRKRKLVWSSYTYWALLTADDSSESLLAISAGCSPSGGKSLKLGKWGKDDEN